MGQFWMFPNPDGSDRWCVYDSINRKYVPGLINVTRQEARKGIGEQPPTSWEELSHANGWLSPEEVETKIETALDLAEHAGNKVPEESITDARRERTINGNTLNIESDGGSSAADTDQAPPAGSDQPFNTDL